MKSRLWIVNLGFIPHSINMALLFLRVALGLSMLILHGWDKLIGYRTVAVDFMDIGVGRHLSLLLALFAEVVCSALLVVGALSRFAAAVLAIAMSVALFKVHHGDMTQAGGGELAAMYLFGYVTILLAGGGRYSADGAGGPWALTAFGIVAGAVAGYPLSYTLQPAAHPLVGSLTDYMANFRAVLRDDELSGTAIWVWVGTVVLFAIVAGLIGRAMYRQRGLVPAGPLPPPDPTP
jgi:putative oxidoreductase